MAVASSARSNNRNALASAGAFLCFIGFLATPLRATLNAPSVRHAYAVPARPTRLSPRPPRRPRKPAKPPRAEVRQRPPIRRVRKDCLCPGRRRRKRPVGMRKPDRDGYGNARLWLLGRFKPPRVHTVAGAIS